MEYEAVLDTCSNASVSAALKAALALLFSRDLELLDINGDERAIAHRLALYLEPAFENYRVDFSYNRVGTHPKRLALAGMPADAVYPDIIVHKRRLKDNLLVIELKKSSNLAPRDRDFAKLEAFRTDPDFEYAHALFLEIGVGAQAGTVTDCVWV